VAAPIATTAGSTAAGATLRLEAHNNINLDSDLISSAFPLTLYLLSDQDGSGSGQVNWGSATLDLEGGRASIKKGAPGGGSPDLDGHISINAGSNPVRICSRGCKRSQRP